MGLLVGSARINEKGTVSGGKAGDQTKSEVSTQAYYMHSKGWYCLRAKSVSVANAIANAMLQACQNDNIGYCQSHRSGVIEQLKKYGSLAKIATATEADCSSLVRACCIQAGFDPGNFNTASEASVLASSGKFMDKISVSSGTTLYNGDILVTKTQGHTVVVVSGNPRQGASYYPKYTGSSDSIVTALAAVGEKDTSKAHRAKIAAANGITNYTYSASQNLKMVNLLKAGSLIKA